MRASTADPSINFTYLKLPEPADSVCGHSPLGNPGVDAVLGDPKVL